MELICVLDSEKHTETGGVCADGEDGARDEDPVRTETGAYCIPELHPDHVQNRAVQKNILDVGPGLAPPPFFHPAPNPSLH